MKKYLKKKKIRKKKKLLQSGARAGQDGRSDDKQTTLYFFGLFPVEIQCDMVPLQGCGSLKEERYATNVKFSKRLL